MPTPRYQQSIATSAMPGVRVNTQAASEESFGGGNSAENIARAGTGLESIVQKEKDRADKIAVTEADARASMLKTQMFFDPTTGAMNKKGKDAVGAIGEYEDEYNKQLSQITETLSNPAQKAQFMQRSQANRAEFSTQLQKHASAQIQEYEKQVTESSIAVAKNDAMLNFSDPAAIATQLYKIRETIGSSMEGQPPEAIKLAMDEQISATHAGVIDRMLANGLDPMAEEYMKANKAEMVGQQLVSTEKQIAAGTLLGFSQRESDKIMQRGTSLSQAMEQARQVEDPKKRQALESELKTRYAQRENEINDTRKRIVENSMNTLEQSGGDLADVKRDTKRWLAMGDDARQALERRSKQLRTGEPPVTDWKQYYDVKTLASTDGTRDAFLKKDLMLLRPMMADSQFNELVDLQLKLRNGGDATKLMGGYRTMTQIVSGTASKVGISKNPEQLEMFQRSTDESIRAFESETGKKATTEDVQRIVDNLVVKGVTDKGWVWDTRKRAFEVNNDEGFEVEIAEIPRAERTKIEAALKSQFPTMPVNDAAIAMLYNRRLNKGKK